MSSSNISPIQNGNVWRTSPLYTLGEAASLARVSVTTVRRWLAGYQANGRPVEPIIPIEPDTQSGVALVNFLQLAEIVVASKFRRNKLSYDRIRSAREYAKEKLGIDYPFAKLDLEAIGGHIIHQWEQEHPGPGLLVLDSPEQRVFPDIVKRTIQDFDPDDNKFALRWFPLGRTVPIVIDPLYESGMPTIPERRITIHSIYSRFKAGYDPDFIADDLQIQQADVLNVIRYAQQIKAA